MALHPKVRSLYEHLVGTELIGQNARGFGWNAEGLAVPLKNRCCSRSVDAVAEPSFCLFVMVDLGCSPAEFLDRIAFDLAPQRLAHQLSAETVANDRDVFDYRFTDQLATLFNPREWIVRADGSAHQADA